MAFGFGNDPNTEEGGNLFTRQLHAMPFGLAQIGASLPYIYGISGDPRRPADVKIIKELQRLAPEGTKFKVVDMSKEKGQWWKGGIFPSHGSRYQPDQWVSNKGHKGGTGTIYNVQRGKTPDISIMAHEAGHAQQFTKGSPLNKISMKTRAATTMGLPLFPLMVADTEDTARTWAGIGTMMETPTFLHEMEASMKGRNLMQQAYTNTGKDLGFLKSLGPFKGMPTYALAMAAPYMLYKYLKYQGQYEK